MLNITNQQRNANQNCNDVSPHSSQNGCHQKIYKQQMLERVWRKGTLLYGSWEFKLVQPLWRTVWRFLKKLKNRYDLLPYNLAIPLLAIYTEKSIIQKDTCTSVLIAGLLIIVRTLKQPKCPSTEEWITKLCGTYIQRNITQP